MFCTCDESEGGALSVQVELGVLVEHDVVAEADLEVAEQLEAEHGLDVVKAEAEDLQETV